MVIGRENRSCDTVQATPSNLPAGQDQASPGTPSDYGTADVVHTHPRLIPGRQCVYASYLGSKHLLLYDIQIQGVDAMGQAEVWYGQVASILIPDFESSHPRSSTAYANGHAEAVLRLDCVHTCCTALRICVALIFMHPASPHLLLQSVLSCHFGRQPSVVCFVSVLSIALTCSQSCPDALMQYALRLNKNSQTHAGAFAVVCLPVFLLTSRCSCCSQSRQLVWISKSAI